MGQAELFTSQTDPINPVAYNKLYTAIPILLFSYNYYLSSSLQEVWKVLQITSQKTIIWH